MELVADCCSVRSVGRKLGTYLSVVPTSVFQLTSIFSTSVGGLSRPVRLTVVKGVDSSGSALIGTLLKGSRLVSAKRGRIACGIK